MAGKYAPVFSSLARQYAFGRQGRAYREEEEEDSDNSVEDEYGEDDYDDADDESATASEGDEITKAMESIGVDECK